MHEGAEVDSLVANVNVIGDSTLSYSIKGANSSDFSVDNNGKIKVAKTLDYNSKNIYDLTLEVKGRNDTVDVPFTVILNRYFIY